VFLVSVSGACSRSGKTALAAALVRAAGSAAAVKFTTTEDVFQRCPRGTPCVVCDIDVPYRLVTDPSVLRQPGTDTDRLAAAGATPVVWCIARESAVERAWSAVRDTIAGEALVVMEGSTIVARARPALHVFVAHPFLSPARWKAGSGALIASCDAVVVNRPARETRDPDPRVWEALLAARGRDDLRLADVTRPVGEWAPDLAFRLEVPARAVGATA
jgi:hypothetical protein